MGFFDIAYGIVTSQNLPVRLRKAKHKAWLRALVEGSVGVLYLRFRANRAANLYDLGHNGQVCYMEALLNDAFDNTLRRIFISDTPFREPWYEFTNPERKITYLALDAEVDGSTPYPAPTYVYTEREIMESLAGFIVNVPAALVYDDARLKALVNKYRLPSITNWYVKTF